MRAASNSTKNHRYSSLFYLYTPKKVRSKKHIEKQCVRISKKQDWESCGEFKKWGVKVGSSEE
ncbi:hypothetical protein C7B09_15485 [Escherichia albertii]|uniref:Uncharacterized protein n=1 Tax=Escherichia albertii TaxID=208962 RepID=A0ABX5HGM6_ESCAL|nr:hypothetical protein C7B09_15485 [Escherichia albertii]